MIEKIQAQDIEKKYGSKFALECSLEIRTGPLYAIVGPNGSGKSTLLRILSLNEIPDKGAIIFHNDRGSVMNPYNDILFCRKTVLVPTRAVLFNETVFNNVAYGLKLRKIPKQEIRERVIAALHDVRLPGKENMHPGELSSGEAQRLALARAFAIDPDILFLDEPTASLDPENTRIIEDIIAEWRSRSDKIVALVTHSLTQAKVLSDRLIFMQKGRIEEFSDTAQFFNRPPAQLAQKFVI